MINNFEVEKDKLLLPSKIDFNSFVSVFAVKYMAELSSQYENSKLIEILELTNKNLQRCLHKPEHKKDFIKDEKLLEFILENPEKCRNLIGHFSKMLNELKNNCNAIFSQSINIINSPNKNNQATSNTSPVLSDNSETNYFLIEDLTDIDQTQKSFNFIYFIIISPVNKSVKLLTSGSEIKLNYTNLHSILGESSRTSWLSELFNKNIEDYIEDKVSHHVLNLDRIFNEIIEINKSCNFIISLENFKFEKKILTHNYIEEMKNIFKESEMHLNFLTTNNVKYTRRIFENGFNYYCYNNQIRELK